MSIASTLDNQRKAAMVRAENTNLTSDSQHGAGGFAIILMIVAVILVLIGFYNVYGSISGAKIVGGDAYDYIIYTERGLAWIGAGLACAILACASLLYEMLTKKST